MSAITDSPSRRRRDSWVANPPAKASVGSTKSVCVIGAGHVGAPHAIMMAKKCPSVKFTVVDDDERRVAAFKSSSLLPFYEPGMAETLDDVKGECLVLPIIRVQGGVYFLQKQFGCSLVASKLLVLQQERSTTDFAFGDVVMVDSE